MSIVNYLGCNFSLPYSKENSDEKVLVGENFSDYEMRNLVKKHLTTKNIYEVFTNEGVGISFDADNQDPYTRRSNKEAQESFLALCDILNGYLEQGDYCELYTCWVGEEEEEKEFEQTININNFDINHINIFEKTLLVIKK
ncbi:hypothetical protein [Halalkalibacter akibai]|uniref:Uncharacterized protein n=1 Tax=Halalkalibacter akibai (strain ATCC 43226 / DSM 21942 / CIP 109018 / JCM 9157 / 1139) TaxID=1236973 RepID=W4QYX8_HALA3|nr:hypothetical protein [Halalkalibacter akibai]GAE36494.1 hypothetical protein JCM9157_3685 [Halalkalibacter akibai JCM 9157]